MDKNIYADTLNQWLSKHSQTSASDGTSNVWSQSLLSNNVWGQPALSNNVWGQPASDNNVWGQQELSQSLQ